MAFPHETEATLTHGALRQTPQEAVTAVDEAVVLLLAATCSVIVYLANKFLSLSLSLSYQRRIAVARWSRSTYVRRARLILRRVTVTDRL